MSTADIDKAVTETIVEQSAAVIALAQDQAAEAQQTAAAVIAASETTALGIKINSIEERLNTWPTNDVTATILPLLTEIMAELQELKNCMAEMLDLLTELEPEAEAEPETLPSIPPISPEEMTSPPRDEKSGKPAPEPKNQRPRQRLL